MARDDGLTDDEGKVMDSLTGAARDFASVLETQHPQELDFFMTGIHQCQSTLALRVARRAFPDGWPIR